ncbi:DNA primase family protein [Thermococcus paralvinellae]|uniref:SF3 helicase domain-containing protein n=1 Tax=Thermococcus paralvinellae TaxID=582419 RepID=W0I700_9EURY|nr:phage/plasmid primase, P4 family [Thermococcus paralvinellae]AHF80188.1 Hypothetical protein TES1_0802 [Thermococcus paralvinellae]
MEAVTPNSDYAGGSISTLWTPEELEKILQDIRNFIQERIKVGGIPKYDEWGRPLGAKLPEPHELLQQKIDPQHPDDIKPSHVADVLMKYYRFATLDDTEEVLFYYQGKYHFGAETRIIKREVQNMMKKVGLEHKATRYFVNEVIGHIQRSTYVSRDEFDKNPYIVNCKNGLLDIENWTFLPHTPEYLSLRQINAEFNPDAVPRRFVQFLNEVLGTREDYVTITQFLGYILLGDNRYQKMLILFGPGNNGKSTLIKIIKHFLGKENISARPPQDLIENRFARADLYGKMVNISDDIPWKAFKSTGLLKMFTSGDTITAEKKFKNSFEFENRAKFIFAGNVLPRAHDATEAFYRRLLIVILPKRIPPEKKIPNLDEKIATPEELSGIFNLALVGLALLLHYNGFIYAKSPEEVEKLYEKLSNPVAMFVEELVVRDKDSWIPKDELYEIFVDFCESRKLPKLTEKAFARELRRLLPDIQESMKAVSTNNYVRAWVGITVKPLKKD